VRDSGNTVQNLTQVNQLSTPVLIALMLGLAVCIALSADALFIAQQAKTEARVALNHAEEGRIANEVNKALIQAYLPKKE
jgi:flagellar biosynthesis/type III secretory pathway M-ring protein FliF/YscJ